MKKKILSVFLVMAMLVTMVPLFGMTVSAEEGTVYTVTDAASITALIADTTKNVAGNTMKLTQDITYEASSTSLWNGLKMNVDGDGHVITLKDGTYNLAILFQAVASETTTVYTTVKNLAVVMENDEAVAYNAGQVISLFGQYPDYVDFTIEGCYFDVNLKVGGANSNNGVAVVFSRYTSGTKPVTITAKDSYFALDAVSYNDKGTGTAGQQGALLGRRWGNAAGVYATYNVENCGFKVTLNGKDSGAVGAVSGNHRNANCTKVNGKGTNYIYNGLYATDYKTDTTTYDTNFVRNVKNTGIDTSLTLAAGWTYTTTGSPMPAAVVKNFPSMFDNTVADAITEFEGYQTSVKYQNAAENEVFDIRLVATIKATDEAIATYKNVGFKIVANYGDVNVSKANDVALTTMYTSVLARNGVTEDKTYTVADLLGEGVNGYIFALPIKNISAAAGEITFEVTTYYTNADDVVVEGSTYTFVVDANDVPSGSVSE